VVKVMDGRWKFEDRRGNRDLCIGRHGQPWRETLKGRGNYKGAKSKMKSIRHHIFSLVFLFCTTVVLAEDFLSAGFE